MRKRLCSVLVHALVASVVMVASAATVQAQTEEQAQDVTITPYDGYGTPCPASGSTLGKSSRCDLKVEGLAVAEVGRISVEGVAADGTATAIGCSERIDPDPSWAWRCGGPTFLNWNRVGDGFWEVWINQAAVAQSGHAKIRVSVGSVAWEGTAHADTDGTTGTRFISHNTGQPRVLATNAAEAAAWNQAVCHNGDTNGDGRCTTSDEGFEWTGEWGEDPELPPLPDWIVTACADNAVSFTNSYGIQEACPS